MSGIYIHIPFCKQACSYCDFYFVTKHQQKSEFVDVLIKEITSKKNTSFTKEPIHTLYFGGGTPSLLTPTQIEQILIALDNTFSLELQECTIELNPDDVTKEYLFQLKALGVTRASMGIQTFDEELLQIMHRVHNRKEAIHCFELLAQEGFESFSVDLIYGNPNQSIEMLKKDLELLCSFKPPHVSAYSLTIEDGTSLAKQLELGRVIPLEDDKVAQHFKLVQNILKDHGIEQYEVSNFAKQGFEAKHNSLYWSHQNYIGFGPGAHSFWWDEHRKSANRWNKKRDLNFYLNGGWVSNFEDEKLILSTLAEERLMLGLRTRKGINLKEMKDTYNFSFSESQIRYLENKSKEDLLLFTSTQLLLTGKGLLFADLIVLDLNTV